MTETSFWVAIPHELIVAISEDYPNIGQCLADSAVVATAGFTAEGPLRADVRRRYHFWHEHPDVAQFLKDEVRKI